MATLRTGPVDSMAKENIVKRARDLAIKLMITSLLLACSGGGAGSSGAMGDVGGVGGVNQAQPTITDANVVPEPIPIDDEEGPPSDFKAPEPDDDPEPPKGPSDLKAP